MAQGGGGGEGAAKSHYEKDICVYISKQGRDRERGRERSRTFCGTARNWPQQVEGVELLAAASDDIMLHVCVESCPAPQSMH